MPGFDGTGPLGQGPFTGGGRGFCVVPLNYSRVPDGNSDTQNRPVNFSSTYQPNYSRFTSPISQYPYYTPRFSGYLGGATNYYDRRSGRPFGRNKGMRGRGRRS